MVDSNLKKWILDQAREIGFDLCGFVSESDLKRPEYLTQWLSAGCHGEMDYLNQNLDKRNEPSRIIKNCRSILVLGTNYFHEPATSDAAVARYAYGTDYHIWIKSRLEDLATRIGEKAGEGFVFRSFVDTGPLLERDLAETAGIGWIGKNTCLINADKGSFLFLSVILTNLEISNSELAVDQCESCQLCIDACPTQALDEYQLNASKCLAYHNIEKRGERESQFWKSIGNHLVGCDICQEVCPWNQKITETHANDWRSSFREYELTIPELLQMSKSQYQKRYRKSAVSRIKYLDMMRNVFLVIGNGKLSKYSDLVQNWKAKNKDHDLAELKYCLDRLSPGAEGPG